MEGRTGWCRKSTEEWRMDTVE